MKIRLGELKMGKVIGRDIKVDVGEYTSFGEETGGGCTQDTLEVGSGDGFSNLSFNKEQEIWSRW